MAYELLSQSRKLNNSGRVGNPQRRGGGAIIGDPGVLTGIHQNLGKNW